MFPNSVNPDRFFPLLKIRLKDMYIAEWRECVRSRTSLMLYREIKNVFERTSDGGNGNHSVSLPIILIKIKVDQMLPSSYISSLLVSFL